MFCLYNKDIDISSCLVDRVPYLFQLMRKQANECMFVLLVRQELFRLDLKRHVCTVLLKVLIINVSSSPRDIQVGATI